MNRRTALKFGAGFGILGGVGLYGGYSLLPPSPSRTIQPVDVLARNLYTSLDDAQRAEACVAYDHPLRQCHNRGTWGGGRSVLLGSAEVVEIRGSSLSSTLQAELRKRQIVMQSEKIYTVA